MVDVPFHKYDSFGRKFLVIDELDKSIIRETQRASFSAEQCSFGEASGVIFVQLPGQEVIEEIDRGNPFWKKKKDFNYMVGLLNRKRPVDAIVRFFRPDGWELALCGDGIRCAAAYLWKKLQKRDFRLLTEIPTSRPKIRAAKAMWAQTMVQAELNYLEYPPDELIAKEVKRQPVKKQGNIFVVGRLEVPVENFNVQMVCFLAYSCEPTILVFCGDTQPFPYIVPETVNPFIRDFFKEAIQDLDKEAKDRMFDMIGQYFNDPRDPLFPAGVSVNFAKVNSIENEIELRTYDRCLKREVLACGNGAAIVAVIAKELGLVSSRRIRVLPKGRQLHYALQGKKVIIQKGNYVVEVQDESVFLEGPVEEVYSGTLIWRGP